MSPEEAADLIYYMAAPALRESFWRTYCEIADARDRSVGLMLFDLLGVLLFGVIAESYWRYRRHIRTASRSLSEQEARENTKPLGNVRLP